MKRSKPILPNEAHDHIHGPADAPLKLVEYGDYQCPYCGDAHEAVKEIQDRLGDQLCFVFRNFPLVDKHPHAEHAAEAAEAAGQQGRFWEMHDWLLENQSALSDDDLADYAAELDFDAKRLMAEVRSGAHASRIQSDVRCGEQNGVKGTPTFFVNGKLFDGDPRSDELSAALNENSE